MVRYVFAPPLIVVYVLIVSALYVHFRGKERHKFQRQLTDHSTFMAPYNALIYLFSGVPNRPILHRDDFPELAPLRHNWQTIRDEARRLYEAEHLKASATYNDIAFNTFFKRGWKRFYLKWYDDFLPSAKELCPQTVALVQAIPSVNAALFAMLAPHSRLGKHRDPFAGSLRYHLGLITPNSDACRIYIDGERYAWRDGEDIIFDETYIHHVQNDTDAYRIILLCDVARPIRNPIVRALNHVATTYLVKATATQNTETEKVGLVNRIAGYIYRLKEQFERLKRMNRSLYYTLKYLLLVALLVLLVVASV